MPIFNLSEDVQYAIQEPGDIPTPRLLVFHDHVVKNMAKMKSCLEEIAPGSGFSHLCPHLKTNKSTLITKMLLDEGISDVKVTMNEVDLALRAGAKSIFIAYPLLKPDSEKVAGLMMDNEAVNFQVQIGDIEHARILDDIPLGRGLKWNYLLDLDVGMHRTGCALEHAFDLFVKIHKRFDFNFTGLHAYEGHINYPQQEVREKACRLVLDNLVSVAGTFQKHGIPVSRLVTSGTPTFNFSLKYLRSNIKDSQVQVSPGTWIFNDTTYDNLFPGKFHLAAAILTRIIDVFSKNQLTLGMGHKRWGIDSGPLDTFSEPGFRVKSVSEEHTVIQHPGEKNYRIGDYVLAFPKHVCPTVNLYESFALIDAEGNVVESNVPIDGRNR